MPFIIEGVVFSVIAYTIGLLMNMVLFNWIANEFAQSTIFKSFSRNCGASRAWVYFHWIIFEYYSGITIILFYSTFGEYGVGVGDKVK